MGFTVYYKSTEPVPQDVQAMILDYLKRNDEARSWLSCEPVGFFAHSQSLMGGSKPNFNPHPDDIAEAEASGLPDGTLQDVIDILCEISARFQVNWELGHDHSEFIGMIVDGQIDSTAKLQISEIVSVAQTMPTSRPRLMVDSEENFSATVENELSRGNSKEDDEDQDGEPQIFKFPGV